MVAASARARRELWVVAAWALLALEIVGLVYLGSRPGGRGPVLVYYLGPLVLGVGALLIAAVGLVVSTRRRPFARPARVAAFAALAVVVGSASYPLPFPARREGRPSRVQLRLPVEGTWTVEWGGPDSARNLLARSRPDRRFGYDLVLELDGRRHAGDGAQLDQWFAFGHEVLAPCAATVVGELDGLPDLPPDAAGEVLEELGNHVVLEIAADEYLVLAGLQQGSVRVSEGQRVASGEVVACVGASGTQRFTRGPHLALHLQDEPEPRWGQGVPFVFTALEVDGVRVERAQPPGRDPAAGLPGSRVRELP